MIGSLVSHPRPFSISRVMLVITVGACLPYGSMHADYLYLKDGRIADGKFVTVEGADYVFRSGKKLIRAAIGGTRSMVLGYRGARVCFRRHGGLRDCSGVLFALRERFALVGRYAERTPGKKKKVGRRGSSAGALPGGWLKAARIPLDTIAFLEFRTGVDGRLPLIRPGAKLRPKSARAFGLVLKADRRGMDLRMADGTKKRFAMKNKSTTIAYLPPKHLPAALRPKKTPESTWSYVVPGLVQWRRNQPVTGGVFLGAFAGFGLLAYQELRHASNLATRINRSPVELYFSSLSGGDRAAQTRHANRYHALLGLQVVAYALHWLHALKWTPFASQTDTDAGTGFPRAGLFHTSIATGSGGIRESGMSLNWEWRF